jgi:hypothetical protein
MAQTTPLATARLTPAETYNQYIKRVRRNAAIERQRVEVRADIERVQALYAEGAPRKAPVEVAPQFTESATFKVTKLAGGLKASVAADKAAVTRRKRELDMSPEAVAKREKRRARRAARKARQAAAAQG